jgi:hypothetical protein
MDAQAESLPSVDSVFPVRTPHIDALGLLGFGGGIWIGRYWRKGNIRVLDLLVSR